MVVLGVDDITDREVVNHIVSAAGGPVDGVMDDFLTPAEVDDAMWDHVFGVNLTGPMRPTRAVVVGRSGQARDEHILIS